MISPTPGSVNEIPVSSRVGVLMLYWLGAYGLSCQFCWVLNSADMYSVYSSFMLT